MEQLIQAQIPLALAGAAQKKWVENVPGQAWSKLLWADAEAGAWATLYFWKQGYVAAPHVHVGDAHLMVLSGRLQVRDGVYGPGDYGYEPKGAVHGATTTLEDCVYFLVCNGPIRMDGDAAAGRPAYEVTCVDVIATDARAPAQA
jgi:anti-sigma factor ChrR (cupin superfamily)